MILVLDALRIDILRHSGYNAVALVKSEKKSRYLTLDQTESRHSAETQSASAQASSLRKTLGQDLKLARLERNVTLKQVSLGTHISLRHLENLEEGAYKELPGGMYNRAFLRSYCVFLDLDPDTYLNRYEIETAAHSEKVVKTKPYSQQMPSPPIKIPPLLIWSVMLLASIAGLYFSRGWISSVFSPYFSQPPVTRIPSAAQSPATTQPKEAPTGQPDSAATGGQVQPGQAQPVAAAAPEPVPDEPPPGTIRLKFEVTQECWMSLTSDGTRIYYGILKPGETPYFDAKTGFFMVLGNAGGVKFRINGKPAKQLGALGAVIRQLINAETIPELLEKTIEGIPATRSQNPTAVAHGPWRTQEA
jgi:cytoskeleton protein RodZ